MRDYHQPKKNQVVNYANQVQDTTMMFHACHKAEVQRKCGVWYLDSGCSNHMISNESLLIKVDKSIKCKVKMDRADLVESAG